MRESIMSCIGCGTIIDCGNIPDNLLFSLEDQPLPFVFDCPEGLDCSLTNLGGISMQCCGQTLSALFPSGASVDVIISIVNNLAMQCARLGNTCGEVHYPPPGTPVTPIEMFFSHAQSCTVFCPDGNPFTIHVRQGIAAAFTQAKADSLAQSIACSQAKAKRFCLTKLPATMTCNQAFTATVFASGAIAPCTWEVTAGALPTGLTLGGFSPNIDTTITNHETIQGTPTSNGTFNFTLKCTGADGSFMAKSYTMAVTGSCVLPVAYWKLDEAGGSVDRVDSIGSAPLQPAGVTDAGVAALISNGVKFTGLFGGASYSTTTLAALKYTSGGFSLWGWVRLNSAGSSDLVGGPLVSYVMSGSQQIYLAAGSNSDLQPFRVSTDSDDAFLNLSLGAWHFFHLFYNPAQLKYGYSIDNGANTYLPTVVNPLPGTATAEVQLQQHYTAATGETIFDEIGLMVGAVLTTTQVAFIYNSGVGRTWPFTLPP